MTFGVDSFASVPFGGSGGSEEALSPDVSISATTANATPDINLNLANTTKLATLTANATPDINLNLVNTTKLATLTANATTNIDLYTNPQVSITADPPMAYAAMGLSNLGVVPVIAGSSAFCNMAVPLVTVSATAIRGVTGQVALQIPALLVRSMAMSVIGDVVVPKVTVTAYEYNGSIGNASIYVPRVRLSASGLGASSAAMQVPAATVSGWVYTVIESSVSAVFPMVEVSGVAARVEGVVSSTTGDVVVVNGATSGHSEYTNYPFSALFVLGGKVYGCATEGIYLLEGTTDANTAIIGSAVHGVSDFGVDFTKRVDSVVMAARVTDTYSLSVEVDEQEKVIYNINGTHHNGIHLIRTKIGKGISGRNWKLGVTNRSGGGIDVRHAEIFFVPGGRRS